MYRNTLTYRFALLAGIFTASVAILSFLEIFSNSQIWAYGVLLPMELLILPASGMCGLVLFVLDIIYKKQFKPFKFNNKFLIVLEWLLIAGYVFVTGYMILGIMQSYLNNPKEALSILGIYFAAGAVFALVVRFIALKVSERKQDI